MCCERLVCAACSGVVAEGRCATCRGTRAQMHGSGPFGTGGQLLLAVAAVLIALLTVLVVQTA